ncbi:MAG: efflux RND transporter periplasmic adaptor subunit [Acidobacteriota bacterium]
MSRTPSNPKLRRMPALALIVLSALAAACKSKPMPAAGPAEVAVVTLRTERLALTTELPGRTTAFLVAEIRPQVNGILQKRLFTEGADVRAGSVLYQIDPAPYQAAFEQAKAALAVAEAKIPAARSRADRFKNLAAINAVGQQDYDDAVSALQTAEAGAESARAALENARINLGYTPIKSPISGRIGRSAVTVGALVNAYQGAPLAVVQQLDPIFVDVIQSSAEVLRLRRFMESGELRQDKEAWSRVRLKLEDGTPYPQEGTLQFRDITVDPTTGSVTLRAVFPNPDKVLLPGMFVRAIVEEGVSDQALLVPQQGVSRDTKGSPYALIVNGEGKVEQRPLEIERAIGDQWLVGKGLAAGDRVITEGQLRVRPGAAVRIAAPAPAPAAAGAAAK